MNIARLVLKTLVFKAWAFEEAARDPIRAQKNVLFEYLRRARDTEYGRRYGFSRIKSIADYQRLVPLSDYNSLYPYIDRMTRGEKNVLVPDKPIFFGLTSGTTSAQKFIPVTKYSIDKKSELADLWAYYISRDHPGVLDGKILAIISPEVEGYNKDGTPYGAESGHTYKNLPEVVKRLYAVPYDVFEIDNYEPRYYCILRLGIEENITTIATLNPSTLVLLCEKIGKWRDRIIDDIARGTLNKDFAIDDKIRHSIERQLKPNPKRARELATVLKEKGSFLPKDFWPNLQLIECWKGGTVKLYLKELPQYFGDIPIRDFGCLSTEARSSIPTSDVGAGGVLAINTNFYEFMPKEDMGKSKKRFLLCDQLEKGREYLIIVTTPAGLYRYDIDDVVTVDGYFRNTPMIEFAQKGMNAVSVTGEKIYESQINAAVIRAADKCNVLPKFFSATVQLSKPARYVFLVEFDGEPSREEKKAFLVSIEEGLYVENSEYKDLRKQQLLGHPILKVVAKGGFEKYRAMRLAAGAHDGQFKVPELVPDPNFQNNFIIGEEITIG